MAQHLRLARGCDISRRRPGAPARGDDELAMMSLS
jgi:hypothetical protein